MAARDADVSVPTVAATVDTGVEVPARQRTAGEVTTKEPISGADTTAVGRRAATGKDVHAHFALTYATVMGLFALGLALAGASSTRWLSYRIISQSPQGGSPQMAFYHLGLWSECGPTGCVHVNASDAPEYVNAARAFALLLIIFAFISVFINSVAAAKAGGVRASHTDAAKLAALFWTFTGCFGIVSMATFVSKRHDQLLTTAGINNVFWDWSMATFTAAWAASIAFIAPLCWIAA